MEQGPSQQKEYLHKDSQDLLHDFHTDLSVGDILQRARMRANISIESAAQETKIQINYLVAIEEGKLNKLPGLIYAIGFIKTYAEFLGLDGNKIVQLLKKQSGAKVEPKPLTSTLPVDEDHSVPTLKTVIIVVAMLSCGLLLYSLSFGKDPAQQVIPSVPEDLKEQVTLLTRPQIAAKPEEIAETLPEPNAQLSSNFGNSATEPEKIAETPHPVVLRAVDNVWLEIRAKQGKVVLSRVLSVGEEYWVPVDQTDLVMTLGNAGGLQILVDGQALPVLGRKGQVIRALPLNPDYLKDLLKKLSKKSM